MNIIFKARFELTLPSSARACCLPSPMTVVKLMYICAKEWCLYT